MEARKDGSERREGSDNFEGQPTGSAGDAQPVGNTRAEGGEPHGLEKLASGVAGIERFPGFREGHMRPLATDADSNATEFTVLLRGSNAHRVIGCNDNRAHAGSTSRAAIVQLWQV